MIEFASELRALNKLLIDRDASADPISHEMLTLAKNHFISGVLMERLRQRLNTQVQHELQTQLRPLAMIQLRQEITQLHVQHIMDAAEVPLLWIKGAALAYSLYSQPYHRPMGDLDCLVRYADYERAARALLRAGYQEIHTPGHSFGGDRELTTHHRQFLRSEYPVLVELHYRFGTTLLQAEEMEWFWQTPAAFPIHNTTMNTLRPEAHFIYLCTHLFIQHDPADAALLHLWDLYLLTRQSLFDWTLVQTQSQKYGWEKAVINGLYVMADLFDSPLPDSVRQWMQSLNTLALSREPIDRFRMAFRKMSWPQRTKLLRQIVFPDRRYLAALYPEQTHHVWRYLLRWKALLTEGVCYGWRRLSKNLRIFR